MDRRHRRVTEQQPIPGVHDNPITWYIPQGDVPDMTEVECEECGSVEMCHAQFDMGNEVFIVCTRPEGHEGSHVAGDADRIVALWDVPDYRIEEEPV